MKTFSITSRLGAEHRAALERLLFFNPLQRPLEHRIVETIERYGAPDVQVREGTLRISLGGRNDVQTIYALSPGDGQPVGVAIFVRESEERFVVVHIGVAADYAAGGARAEEHLLFHLIQAIRGAARRTRGVRCVDLFYGAGRIRQIPV
jgi:hypothetical protein